MSLQELLTRRRGNTSRSERGMSSVDKGDIDIEYDDILEVRLVKSRLYLIAGNKSLSASFPRGYSRKMKPMLENIFESRFTSEESIRAAEAAEKENEKSQHPRGDRGKFPRR